MIQRRTTHPGHANVLPQGPLLTVCDVASLLRVSRATVYNWVNGEKIPYLRINDVVRFSVDRLETWLLEREIGAALRLSETMSRQHLFKARRRLRAALEGEAAQGEL